MGTKAELIDKVAKQVKGVSKKDINSIFDAVFTSISSAIKKDKRLIVPGFGTFNVRNRKARNGRNPKTGEVIKIKASKTIAFKPTPKLKESL